MASCKVWVMGISALFDKQHISGAAAVQGSAQKKALPIIAMPMP
jgi:hypothetical protein